MAQPLSPRARRVLSSVGSGVLVAIVIALGYLTYSSVTGEREGAQRASDASADTAIAQLDLSRFSSRQEKSADGERLYVSFRLRLTAPGTLEAYVFVVARNEQAGSRLWAVWPPQPSGGAVSPAGHIHTTNPSSGHALTVTNRWTRVSATLDQPTNRPPFNTVMVYVLSAKGETLLARPFAL